MSISVLSKVPNLLNALKLKLPHNSFIEVTHAADPRLTQSDIIIADFDLIAKNIYQFTRTKWIQGTWAGVDALLPSINRNDPPKMPIVRFTGDHFGRIITEYVITCIVNHERHLFTIFENQKATRWDKNGKISDYRIIGDLNIGIMGMGNIGNRVGTFLNSLGATIYAFGRNMPTLEVDYVTKTFTKNNLNEFLKTCDYIVNTLPNTDETRGLLNGEILRNCNKSVFINVGRGGIISEGDLINALKKGWLSAAYLDVFEVEPLPETSELWKLEQVKITPHVAAMSRAKDIAEQFAQNYKLYQSGEQFPARLDFNKGY